MVVLFLVYTIYAIINFLLRLVFEDAFLGVGPILFGIFYCITDLLLIGAKHLLLRVFSDARKKENGGTEV